MDIKLADEQFDQPGAIDLLIGADLFYEILRSGRQTRSRNCPVLQETVPGWTLSGRTPAVTTSSDTRRTFLVRGDNSLEINLNCFWEVESVEQSTMTTEQHACEESHNTAASWKIRCQTSNQRGTQSAWNFSLLCRTQTTCNST
jgi:hypothetical protein